MAEAIARLKNYPTSPRKMRYTADLIRGMDVERAMNVLQHAAKVGAKPLGKLLRSAIDNWDKKEQSLAEEEKRTATRVEDAHLFVKVVYVDGGTMLKRWLPAPHGRAFKKRKRSNHITIIVDSKSTGEQQKKQGKQVAEEPVPVEAPQVTEAVAPVKKEKTKKKKEAAVAQ
jgi:large subunit ribosomal protein L22